MQFDNLWFFFGKKSEGQNGVLIPHFVDKNSISSYPRFMQKLCTRTLTHINCTAIVHKIKNCNSEFGARPFVLRDRSLFIAEGGGGGGTGAEDLRLDKGKFSRSPL